MATNNKDIKKLEKKSWYNDRYEFVVVQRNILSLITVLALILSIAATFSVSQLTPLKSVEPFVIQIDQKSGITQVVNPINAKEMTSQEAVNNYFMVQYIRARESYMYQDRNYYNYNLVRVLSDPAILGEYQIGIALSNPESPAARLGNFGSREIEISNIRYINSEVSKTGEDIKIFRIEARVTERVNGQVTAANLQQKVIFIGFKYSELDLTKEDRYLNPIGFRVVSYRIDSDGYNK